MAAPASLLSRLVGRKSVTLAFRTVTFGITFAVALLPLLVVDDWLLLPSLAGSAIILFALPHSNMAQPRSLFGGHLIAASIGAGFALAFGEGMWVFVVATTLAYLLMMLSETIHSPAGADPMIAIASGADPVTLFVALALGLGLLFAGAWFSHNRLHRTRRYPRSWW